MPDTPTDLQDFLQSRLELLIADANEAGYATADVLAGLRAAIDQQRHGYDADPDPANDPDLEASRAAGVRIPRDVLTDIAKQETISRPSRQDSRK